MLGYLKSKRGKSPGPPAPVEAPILTEEDEAFLQRITSEAPASIALPPTPPPRPEDLPEAGNPEGNNTQLALLEEDGKSQYPTSPTTANFHESSANSAEKGDTTGLKGKMNSVRSKWSWMHRDSRAAKQKRTGTDLMSAAETLKPDAKPREDDNVSDSGAKEQDEMANALEQLNLAAVDNHAFSLSKETRELLAKFTLVLKDLTNGVPTAYGDLESLLTNSDDQLQRSYKCLPSWLQKIVKQLPTKLGESVTPEVLAATAEKHGMKSKYADMAARGAGKAGVKVKVPSLRDLVTKPGAIAGMLKAILNFLKLRFPAFLGLNVLYSLGLFILLLCLWYCHKRGREVRLEKERLATEDNIKSLDSDDVSDSSSLRSISTPVNSDIRPKPTSSSKHESKETKEHSQKAQEFETQ